jgi:hypothetical protein
MTDVYVSNLVPLGAIALVLGFNVTLISLIEIAKAKIIFYALIVIAIGIIVPYSAWAFLGPIYTPNWTFSLTTDKSTYELGEPVQIKVTLENHGSVGHSFTSVSSSPVEITIEYRYTNIHNFTYWTPVWYSGAGRRAKTEFMIPPHQSLERTFIWNQTTNAFDAPQIQSGICIVHAYIPLYTGVTTFSFEILTFAAETNINITST